MCRMHTPLETTTKAKDRAMVETIIKGKDRAMVKTVNKAKDPRAKPQECVARETAAPSAEGSLQP